MIWLIAIAAAGAFLASGIVTLLALAIEPRSDQDHRDQDRLLRWSVAALILSAVVLGGSAERLL